MHVKRFAALAVGLMSIVAITAHCRAQQQWPSDDPPFVEYEPWIDATPFVDPLYFEHDFQFFAPHMASEFGCYPEPPQGWYFDYARMYMGITTPEGSLDSNNSTWSYGNRIQAGYWTENQTGWMFEYQHVDGPSTELLSGRALLWPQLAAGVALPVNLAVLGVLPNGDVRTFQNFGNYQTVEFCKAFRQDQYHHGGVMELFFGAHYTSFTDFSHLTTDVAVLNPAGAVIGTLEGVPLTGPETNNRIWSAVVGARYRKEKGRWVTTVEARLLPGVNFQHFAAYRRVDGDVVLAGNILAASFTNVAAETRDEFVIAGDVRAQAQLMLTRDISITGGFEMTYFGNGIARYGTPDFNNENLVLAGVTFGVVVNR